MDQVSAAERRPISAWVDVPGAPAPPPHDPAQHPDATDAAYVDWLVRSSMLAQAAELARGLSGTATLWHRRFAQPDGRAAVEKAPVWLTTYPVSMLAREGVSFLGALADPELWAILSSVGVTAVHTGPVKLSGGLDGWLRTPSVDGNFDRISTAIDPVLGTTEEFRDLVRAAGDVGGTVIDDLIPGHTGSGPDFRLAEMAHSDYPGLYHLVEVAPEHWSLLPAVAPGASPVNLDVEQEAALRDAGYIVGPLQRVLFYEPGVKETNWSATGPVLGVDGVRRRWVYLHMFKSGQPQLSWLDPSFAAARLVAGDIAHSLTTLGSRGMRLDANGFLGVERGPDGQPGWSEGHPLSVAANHLIAGLVRRLGGFTFQELNLSLDAIQRTAATGPDLSYDFVTRPAYHHALATGDTEFLRLCLAEARRVGLDRGSLVHALQNHDELTYELVHFADTHSQESFDFRGRPVTGAALAELVRADLLDRLTGPRAPYNHVFSTNGIACTTASVITAVLGIEDLDRIGPDEVDRVRDVHLMLAAFNAWQPGVMALSAWDLVGALTLGLDEVADLVRDGDTRWINRGAHDLLGVADGVSTAPSGIPVARSLYGSLVEQQKDPRSFLSGLAAVLRVRQNLGLSTATPAGVADSDSAAVLGLQHVLYDTDIQLTVINFSGDPVTCRLSTDALVPGHEVRDVVAGSAVGLVDDERGFVMTLAPYDYRALRVEPAGLPAVAPVPGSEV
jgi:trehalose synthase